MSYANLFERLLLCVSKPSRYLGNEINAVKKDPGSVDLLVCLAFPDVYEVGMSHLGLQILYHVLNSRPQIACERVFAPWPDMEHLMETHDIPLLTLESRIPVRTVDILGFSLEYELCYATAVRMLAAARIPVRARDRSRDFPLVIAGGPCTYNPEPVAEFFDAFVIGEGEEVILELCNAFLAWRRSGMSKQALLEALAEIEGIYVPSLFIPDYTSSGELRAMHPLKSGYTSIRKRIVTDFGSRPFWIVPIVPYMQTIHDRAQVEIARGCTRGCRFCLAGMIYRPVRERSIDHVCMLSRRILASTGYEELSLVSLSAGDYTGIEDLIRLLVAEHRKNRVAVSLPSLRVATLTQDMIQEIKSVRKTGFTIAPEAGSQRLRLVINKGIDEDEILETADRVFNAGWRLLKLYFMIGLPTETDDDIYAIVDLCRKIVERYPGRQLNVSVSTFVPKPHTPFQWEAQEHPDRIYKKQLLLKRHLHRGQVQVKYHDRFMSVLEGIFSRGDRRLGPALLAASRRGAEFDAWREHFKYDLWMEVLKKLDIDPFFYLRERSIEEYFPWSHISCGVTTEFLKREREKALRSEATQDCRVGGCNSCGICSPGGPAMELSPIASVPAVTINLHEASEQTIWVRLLYSKTGPARFLSHLELSRTLARAMRRADLPLKYSQGFHPLPRILLYQALPVGIEGLGEVCDIEIREWIEPWKMATMLQEHLPQGITIEAIISAGHRRLVPPDPSNTYRFFPEQGCEHVWPPQEELQRATERFLASSGFSISFVREGTQVTVDLKTIVRRLEIIDHRTVEISLDASGKKIPKIAEIAGRIFNLENHCLRIVKMPALDGSTSIWLRSGFKTIR